MADRQGQSTSGANKKSNKLTLSKKARTTDKGPSGHTSSVTSMAMALITTVTAAITTSILNPIRTTLTTASNFNTNRAETYTTNSNQPIASTSISQPMDYDEAILTTEDEANIPKSFTKYSNRPTIFPNIQTLQLPTTMSTQSLPGPSSAPQTNQPDQSFSDITIHNLCHKLTSHLHSKLFHEERAHIFRSATSHSNPPSFLQPPLDITEYRRFSPKSRARWDSWVSNFQLGLCDILREHHEDQVVEEDDDIVFQTNTIYNAYPNKAFLEKMVMESKQKALALHQKHNNFQFDQYQPAQNHHQTRVREHQRKPRDPKRRPREHERNQREHQRKPREHHRKPRH